MRDQACILIFKSVQIGYRNQVFKINNTLYKSSDLRFIRIVNCLTLEFVRIPPDKLEALQNLEIFEPESFRYSVNYCILKEIERKIKCF